MITHESAVEPVNLPMWAINMSSTSVDSRRTLQSKFNPPGASPFCSITACRQKDIWSPLDAELGLGVNMYKTNMFE